MQEFTSDVVFNCPMCAKLNEQTVHVPELNFMAERSRDMAVEDEVEIECTQCGAVFSGDCYVDTGSTFFQMSDPVEFEFHGDMPTYGPDFDDYIPEDPFSISMEALTTLKAMVGQIPVPQGDVQFGNRLVFAGAITAMETYFSDTLISAVRDSEIVLKTLATNNNQLGSITLSVAQLTSQQDGIQNTMLSKLKDIIYHNLRIVLTLYYDAFGFRPISDKNHREKLFKAVMNRHDCVHRNGQNKEGDKLTIFTDEYVRETIDLLEVVISETETSIHKKVPVSF